MRYYKHPALLDVIIKVDNNQTPYRWKFNANVWEQWYTSLVLSYDRWIPINEIELILEGVTSL